MAVTRKYAQINACTNEVVLIGDESLGMPVADSNLVYTINISSHSQKDEIDVYWTYSKTTELFTAPSKDPLPIPVVHEIIADSAEKSGSNTIVLTVSQDFMTGTVVKFVAPCDCVGISKIKILDKTFSLVDAVGNTVSTISGTAGGVFSANAIVAIALNVETLKAYIQNAAKVDNVYTKDEVYKKSEVYSKDETYSKQPVDKINETILKKTGFSGIKLTCGTEYSIGDVGISVFDLFSNADIIDFQFEGIGRHYKAYLVATNDDGEYVERAFNSHHISWGTSIKSFDYLIYVRYNRDSDTGYVKCLEWTRNNTGTITEFTSSQAYNFTFYKYGINTGF